MRAGDDVDKLNWDGFRSERTCRNLRFRPIVTWSSATLRRASRERRSISLSQGDRERCQKNLRTQLFRGGGVIHEPCDCSPRYLGR